VVLEQRRQPARHALVVADMAAADARELGERGGCSRRGRDAIGEREGVEQREVRALAELRARRVCGIADEHDAAVVHARHAHVAVARERDLFGRFTSSVKGSSTCLAAGAVGCAPVAAAAAACLCADGNSLRTKSTLRAVESPLPASILPLRERVCRARQAESPPRAAIFFSTICAAERLPAAAGSAGWTSPGPTHSSPASIRAMRARPDRITIDMMHLDCIPLRRVARRAAAHSTMSPLARNEPTTTLTRWPCLTGRPLLEKVIQ